MSGRATVNKSADGRRNPDLLRRARRPGVGGPIREQAAVERELERCREFIEDWLAASDEPRPRRVGERERELRTRLGRAVRDLRNLGYDREFVEYVLRTVQYSGFSPEHIEECIQDAMSAF